MPTYTKPSNVVAKCDALKLLWAGRDRKIAEWYDTLALFDELKQEGMESVVGNDPRVFYNTALHLLAPNIPHRIPTEGLDKEAIAWTSSIERVVTGNWSRLDKEYRHRGRKSWMEYVVGLLLSTGWYAVLCMATSDRLVAEAWNPVEVYPDWDSEGLSSVAHIFTIQGRALSSLFKQHGKEMPIAMKNGNHTVYDLWEVTDDGVINVTVVDSAILKPEQVTPFSAIPIYTGPVGGLPDDGAITSKRRGRGGNDWRADVGQSILATNEGTYKSYNRSTTFLQQILRDTAQPKYWERSRGSTPILTNESLNKRGAIFRLGEGDDVGTIAMPGIPVELTSLIGSYEAQIQRGALPHALSGQVEKIPLGLMSQVAAAAVQMLSRYHSALTGLLTDIDNNWVEGMLNKVYQAETLIIPDVAATDALLFDIKYTLNIPGDLIQRATVVRMIAPATRMSPTTALDLFFPEIQDPIAEQARARADDAQNSPVFVLLTLISALREESRLLRTQGNSDDADLLDKAQEAVMAQVTGTMQGEQGGSAPGGIPPAGMAPDQQALVSSLGMSVEG